MPKRSYTHYDRAAVFAALEVNQGNVKRTARETNIPVSTVRDWKREWENGEVPEDVKAVLPEVIEDIVEALSRVRDKGLLELERAIDAHELKGSALVAAVGMLTDKIRLYKGQATQVREERMELPPSEELRELVSGFFDAVVTEAENRANVIDAEVVETTENPPKALAVVSSN